MKTVLQFIVMGFVGALASMPAAAQFGGWNLNKLVEKAKKGVEAIKPIDDAEEVNIGEGAAAVVLGAIPLHGDANLQGYVNRVGRWLAAQSGRPLLPWAFGVLNTPTINAFAVPGGKVFVSAGLIARLKNESELAGVLAHEIAHVSQRHSVTAIEASRKSGFLQGIAQEKLNERIAASRAGSNPLTGALTTAAAAEGIDFIKNGVFLRPLDRSLEYEADRIGALIAAKAGYDPYGFVAVLQMLAALKPEEGGSLTLSTHPSADERLSELEKFAATLDRYAGQAVVEERFRSVIAAIKN